MRFYIVFYFLNDINAHPRTVLWMGGLRMNIFMIYPDEIFPLFFLERGLHHFYAMQDYVEGARTAAINQEIKRVLTEVLLKVFLLNLAYIFSANQ